MLAMTLKIIGSFLSFQAEDGIRDYKVTGVQTCALPISPRRAVGAPWPVQDPKHDSPVELSRLAAKRLVLAQPPAEIGRASCRERVWDGDSGYRFEEKTN